MKREIDIKVLHDETMSNFNMTGNIAHISRY
jgi:hypothetical protein